jgi:hypothetical protein
MKAYKAVMKGGLQGVSFDTDSNGEGIVNWELKEGDEILVRENKSTCSGVKMYRVLDRPEVGYIPKTAIHIIGEAEYVPTPLSPPESYEMVNHPSHYNNYSVEVIEMMERIYGARKTMAFCEMNAFKYRMRLGTKPDNSIEQDLAKEKWYLNKARLLRAKLENNESN